MRNCSDVLASSTLKLYFIWRRKESKFPNQIDKPAVKFKRKIIESNSGITNFVSAATNGEENALMCLIELIIQYWKP